jgi:hypothetical protein
VLDAEQLRIVPETLRQAATPAYGYGEAYLRTG